jgi:hypothetical protein
VTVEPPIIAYLRRCLAARESKGTFGVTCTTTGPWPKGTTIRPELLSVGEGGQRNWRLTWPQVEKFLAAWDDAVDDSTDRPVAHSCTANQLDSHAEETVCTFPGCGRKLTGSNAHDQPGTPT